ncbi:MAG: glycosyltransferase family 39 protein, partial [Kiritimatiellae bacterium]|nr:glycosyltransferase family 39 protein [Kiritimatiellia bacterium]
QELPYGGYATKPPLTAWLQAACHAIPGVGWDVALRLPPFAAALALLLLIYRCGLRMGGTLGAALAVTAFAFNMMSVRIATLVRTDMLLALFCFLPGLMILNHIERRRAWSRRDAFFFFLALLAAVFTKGHTVYAFLLPGMAAFAFIQRKRHEPNRAWPGWIALLLPILLLLGALVWAVWRYPEFYEQIVLGEMVSAFQTSEGGKTAKPFLYYVAHILHRWSPWSLLLILLAGTQAKRLKACWKDPVFVWLVCWMLGGLLVMSAIPDKRSDRLFPLLPPLTLLLVYFAALYDRAHLLGLNYRRFMTGVIVIGACLWTAYGLSETGNDLRKQSNALRLFSSRIADQVSLERLSVAGPSAEGFLCYFEQTRSMTVEEAVAAWKEKRLDALVISRHLLEGREAEFEPYAVLDRVQDPFNEESYSCIIPAESVSDTP